MARSYLDKIGLSHLWDLFKAYLMRRNLVPEQSKTFEGVIATANSDPAGFLYFGQVKPDDYYIPYKIKYHMEIEIAGLSSTTQSKSDFNVEIRGLNNTYYGYRIDNVVNINYRSIYGHIFYPCTLTGYNKGYGGLVGIRLQSAYNPANTANARIVKIEILETENCTFKFFDFMTLYANVEGSGSANYYSRYILDGTTNGHKVYGDANDVNYYNRNYYGNRKAAAPIYRYQLCVSKKDRSVLSLSTVDNNVSTNKTLTTESFDPFGDILYWNSGTTYTTGANVGDGWYNQYLADIRYTFNIGGNSVASTLVARKPLYLVTVLQSDGNVKLHSNPLAQDLPTTEDGLLYIYLGQMYPDTNPYRLYMSLHHPIYLFKNGHITNYTNNNDFVSVEQQPYSFRKSGGGVAVGDREYDQIVGGTVCWNQCVQIKSGATVVERNGITCTPDFEKQTIHISGTATMTGAAVDLSSSIFTTYTGNKTHKYYSYIDTGSFVSSITERVQYAYGIRGFGTSADNRPWIIIPDQYETGPYVQFYTVNGQSYDFYVKFQLHDLTAMFGNTVADYIYQLEQTTAGAGVAFFKALFPNDYYEYNSGELKSVEGLSAHKMVGFNQWDEEWEIASIDWSNYMFTPIAGGGRLSSKNYIPVFPDTTYYINKYVGNYIAGYDNNNPTGGYPINVVSGRFTTPSNCHFIKFGLLTDNYGKTYKNDICINIFDPARNGEYEPYKEHSYPLDSTVTLRGLFKLDANNKLYADGDTYDADGKVTRKYGIYVFTGNETWSVGSVTGRFTLTMSDIAAQNTHANGEQNVFSSKYGRFKYVNADKTAYINTTANARSIVVNDSALSTVSECKAAFAGSVLIYELATPTTEQATPYQNPQSVNEYGTEEYISTSIIPIGHYTEYPASKKLIKNVTNNYNDIATQNKMGYMSASDKTKLDGIATGAEVNQNAFSNVKVGTTTIFSNTKTDTLELVAGSNITLTPDTTNDKVTIAMTSNMVIQNIASNANLNTITTDGWYMASTDAIASSLSNCPSTKSFLMEVYHINSATGSNEVIYQKISTSENIHYERVKSGGVWSEWKSSCHIDLNGVVYI